MSDVINMFKNELIIPILIIIIGSMIGVLKYYLSNIEKKFIIKNELDEINKSYKIRKQIFDMVDDIVKASVASNMSMANDLKNKYGYLSDEQIEMLNNNVRDIINISLPISTFDDDSQINKIIGGKETIDTLVSVLLEKYVYEYKLKQVNIAEEPEEENTIISNIDEINGIHNEINESNISKKKVYR